MHLRTWFHAVYYEKSKGSGHFASKDAANKTNSYIQEVTSATSQILFPCHLPHPNRRNDSNLP
jgi:hypothetical protein